MKCNFLKNVKYVFVSFFVILLIYSQTFVYADDSWNVQWNGSSNPFSGSDGKIGAALSVLFASKGVYVPPSLYADNLEESDNYTRSLARKLHEYDESLYDWFDEHTSINVDELRGQYYVAFDELFETVGATKIIPTEHGLHGFYEYLFGNSVLTDDPFDCDIQSLSTVQIDGQTVIPWQLTKNAVSVNTTTQYGPSSAAGLFSARGQFILPFDGDYEAFWNDIYLSPNHKKSYTWSFINENDGTSTISAVRGGFTASTATHSSLGPYHRIMNDVDQFTHYTVFWYFDDGSNSSAMAYIPFLTTDGYLGMAYYWYVYNGSYTPTSYNMCVRLMSVNNASGQKPKLNGGDNFELSYDGGDDIFNFTSIVSDDDRIYVYGDSIEDITNNYFTGAPVVIPNTPPYADPNDWQTSPGGTLTPNDNGGFDLGLDNFHLPDLNINWKLDVSGLKNKFPFSIPFDLVKFFTILNAEPQTPRIAGSVDLGLITWDVDFDLSDFDDTAELLRNIEYVAFVVGLIFFTWQFIKR